MPATYRAIRYRIYPTTEQSVFFAKTFGCCRKIYNLMLADMIAGYQENGKFAYVTPAMYKNDYPYLREADSNALCSEWLHLQAAFKNCFDRTRKKRAGFPKFKSAKHSRKSYTTPNSKGCVAIIGNSIKLPKAGRVRAVIHRQPGNGWVLKSATVSQESDGSYYVSVLFELPETSCGHAPDLSNAVGLHYVSDGLYVDSNGNKGSSHKYYRESQKKLAKEQRRLSRMQGSRRGEKKSSNYMKQLRKVNKIHRHIANQRLDQLHKLSAEIANRYDVVCVEDLNMKSMAGKGSRRGKSVMDSGYGMFRAMLAYKLDERNKILVGVEKWYPSTRICSRCGFRGPALNGPKTPAWACPECGASHDWNRNAAANILQEGLRILNGGSAA